MSIHSKFGEVQKIHFLFGLAASSKGVETVRRAHQMQRLSPEIWEGLMLLQLLWGANESIAKRPAV